MGVASHIVEKGEDLERPWSMREPVLHRLVAAGLTLPTVQKPLNFPEPLEPEGEGRTLSELLLSDRQGKR